MHKVRVTNKSEGLSWHPDHKKRVEFDNLGKTLLDPKLFNKIGKTIKKFFIEINAMDMKDTWDPH